MKKKLQKDIIEIAERILKMKGKGDVTQMHAEVAVLYEKLSVLKFAEENFDSEVPGFGSNSSFFGMLDTAFNNKFSDTIEVEDRIYINLDDVEEDDIMEPVMEKIKDIVAQMPQETQQVDVLVEKRILTQQPKSDFDSLTEDFKEMPEFDPVHTSKTEKDPNFKRSINDKFKGGGIHIGLNDKLAFIKHLFNGKREDYDRVLSQLNTAENFDQAHRLIQNQVKPDYNNWKGKEDLEQRFLEIIESKFD
ncbi:hypothetical protein SAMN03097699_2582 [Flavobacteriaceae bacterium MAR_2010_188]|nr:hypothetical protein SAMN03097699_2582 [Flavobacteriaceae bacterium MAR_2010_188]